MSHVSPCMLNTTRRQPTTRLIVVSQGFPPTELKFSTPHSIKALTNTTLITRSSSGSKLDYLTAMTCYLCESDGCTDLRYALWAYQGVHRPQQVSRWRIARQHLKCFFRPRRLFRTARIGSQIQPSGYVFRFVIQARCIPRCHTCNDMPYER
jgi:hypothetical protein